MGATSLVKPAPPPMPTRTWIPMQDPRSDRRSRISVVAFYFPGREEPWDELCGASFLGNFYPVPGGMRLTIPDYLEDGELAFDNAEAAFQATKFGARAHEFRHLSGNEAFQKKRELYDLTDLTYGGFESNWCAMMAVLEAKFVKGGDFAHALLATKDNFLLEHNARAGRDKIWSDNHDGTGANWLGIQLMIVRDKLSNRDDSAGSWTAYFSRFIDLDSGRPRPDSPEGGWTMQETTLAATRALDQKLCTMGATSLVQPAPLPMPTRTWIPMPDPRADHNSRISVVAFYFPGRKEAWDELCGASFLGNFYPVPGGMRLTIPDYLEDGEFAFDNAEAAFQATKFGARARAFRHLSGNEAFQKKNELYRLADLTYGGFESNWCAMMAVLEAKFVKGGDFARVLLATGDDFLLEHNARSGRDKIWSDDHDGTGANWLGIQLMVIRDRLSNRDESAGSWTAFFSKFIDLDSGSPDPNSPDGGWTMQETTLAATRALDQKLCTMGETSLVKPAPPPMPTRTSIPMPDPRADHSRINIVAFYYPGQEEAWDELCGASFLGNFYPVPGGMRLTIPDYSQNGEFVFDNAEAAFQATKFGMRAHEFRHVSGNEAFQKKRELYDLTDLTYGGFESNWCAMMAVLEAKFVEGGDFARALLATEDDFLLEHNARAGRDKIWSDNHDGTGANWLGIQLMIVRDKLSNRDELVGSWTAYFSKFIDLGSGSPRPNSPEGGWATRTMQEATLAATRALDQKLCPSDARADAAGWSWWRPGWWLIAAMRQALWWPGWWFGMVVDRSDETGTQATPRAAEAADQNSASAQEPGREDRGSRRPAPPSLSLPLAMDDSAGGTLSPGSTSNDTRGSSTACSSGAAGADADAKSTDSSSHDPSDGGSSGARAPDSVVDVPADSGEQVVDEDANGHSGLDDDAFCGEWYADGAPLQDARSFSIERRGDDSYAYHDKNTGNEVIIPRMIDRPCPWFWHIPLRDQNEVVSLSLASSDTARVTVDRQGCGPVTWLANKGRKILDNDIYCGRWVWVDADDVQHAFVITRHEYRTSGVVYVYRDEHTIDEVSLTSHKVSSIAGKGWVFIAELPGKSGCASLEISYLGSNKMEITAIGKDNKRVPGIVAKKVLGEEAGVPRARM